jgi:hypothetical protein
MQPLLTFLFFSAWDGTQVSSMLGSPLPLSGTLQALVAHSYNPSYLGGSGWEDRHSRPD